jgi:DNA-binding response OmpR family regulator
VLIVEDEFFQADDVADVLTREGAVIVGPCRDADAALRELDAAPIDLAVLDINLGGGPGFTVADALKARGVPFVFATGYGAATVPDRFADHARYEKPYDPRDLARLLTELS